MNAPRRAPRVVLVAVGDRARASSRIRVHDWVPRLEAEGVSCQVFVQFDGAWMEGAVLASRLPRAAAALRARRFWSGVLAAADGADAVLLQEVIPPTRVSRELARRAGRLVFDFSDPIHVVGGPGTTQVHRLYHEWVIVPRLDALLGMCHAATVENELLVERGERAGCVTELIRGPVDTDRYVPRERSGVETRSGRLVLGWTGSGTTLPYVAELLPTLNELHRARGDIELHLYGVDGPTGLEDIPVRTMPWNVSTEAPAVAAFDVGLNPLPADAWTRLRGGAKLLVYLASGLPIVTTPSGIGDQVVTDGVTGFHARSPAEWREALERLLDDGALRRAQGERGRAEAVGRYSYQAYWGLFTRLLLG